LKPNKKGALSVAKEKKDPYISLFENQKIDSWLEIIKNEAAGDEEKERALKVSARRALTVKNMSAYIVEHDDTPEAKRAFRDSTFTGGTKTLKNGKEVPIQNVNKAASYFIKNYMPDLFVEDKPRENAFDAIADW
jgi:hypothetical protein